MDRRIDAHLARTRFGQIMDRAIQHNERFIIDRRGAPAVVIMSVQDFIRLAAPSPDWLQKARSGAKRRGLDALTHADIDAKISHHPDYDYKSSRLISAIGGWLPRHQSTSPPSPIYTSYCTIDRT